MRKKLASEQSERSTAPEGKANKVSHTPTPWHRNVSPAYKYPIYADANGNPNGKDWIHIAAVLSGNPNAEADLDFIIRAVNEYDSLKRKADSHEALIKIMEKFTRHIFSNGAGILGDIVRFKREMRSAISQAEGKV